jgi:prepilin-type N-terminal cleavage/methylation domain-containing protein
MKETMTDKFKKQKGFTLIELLVVISIIALLSTVVFAALGQSRIDAQWRSFDSEIQGIKTAVQLYTDKNNNNWPTSLSSNDQPLSDLLTELNSEGLYNKTSLVDPDGFEPSVFFGYRTDSDPDDHISCGDPNSTGAYYAIYTCTGVSINGAEENSRIMQQAYQDGLAEDNCYCTEIR